MGPPYPLMALEDDLGRHIKRQRIGRRSRSIAKSSTLSQAARTSILAEGWKRSRHPRTFDTQLKFVHDALKDPEKQIRLFRIRPALHGTDSELHLELATWDIDDAPEYDAISYTWGSQDEIALFINGKAFFVRSNCHYALSQVRQYQGSTTKETSTARLDDGGCQKYIWMDSICIDQVNVLEKGHQVRIMWLIYRQASKVLACVGEAADDSDELMELAAATRSWNGYLDSPDAWLTRLGEDRMAWLHKAFRSFSTRTYWNRLWVIQEVAAASQDSAAIEGRVEILCGKWATPFYNIHTILTLLRDANVHKDSKWHDLETVHQDDRESDWTVPTSSTALETHIYHSFELEFKDIFKLFGSFQCCDPRDRVYGLLHRARIPDSLASSIPDYQISTWDLALKISLWLDFHDIEMMLRALEIDCRHPEMQALIQTRCKSRHRKWSKMNNSYDHYAPPDVDVYGCEYVIPKGGLRKLSGGLDQLDSFFGKPMRNERIRLSKQKNDRARPWLSKHLPKIIFHDQKPVALVASTTRPGDVLFEYTRGQQSLIFVLRYDKPQDSHFDIVGQGLTVGPGKLVDLDPPGNAPSPLQEGMHLSLTPEDKMLLAGQDIILGEDSAAIDHENFLLRLVTNPKVGDECGLYSWSDDYDEYLADENDREDPRADEIAEYPPSEPSEWHGHSPHHFGREWPSDEDDDFRSWFSDDSQRSESSDW